MLKRKNALTFHKQQLENLALHISKVTAFQDPLASKLHNFTAQNKLD
jgi:gamma-glutamyl phosphate reductase